MGVIECCGCHGTQTSFEYSTRINIGAQQYDLCKECGLLFENIRDNHYKSDVSGAIFKLKERINLDTIEDPQLRAFFDIYFNSNGKSKEEVDAEISGINDIQEKVDAHNMAVIKQQEHELSQAKSNMIMTSGHSIEGYRIVEYKGFQSVDVVYKNSLKDSLAKGLEDLGRMLSFKAQVMTGVMDLLENGKEYGFDLFREKVIKCGGNAVIGMDMESTVGSDYVKVQINGTAVVIERL
ncbi:YbjQ family protein [Butyrivibrio sp. AD3002]|uniref:YbjQ family protein n=1 Tax=Butyrivibrio sp. AD3002 TaxID=1280670 RepID=UPI0003B3C174|nr:heavy metal-binding domain-containing protein [Butyrivibrio sp. AD3002]